jgi:predicted thioesterase
MQSGLQPGITKQVEWTVEEKHAATHIGSGTVPVFATPVMIGLMEMVATEAVQPFLPEGMTTVGIHVDVRHLAATPVGMRVIARAELLRLDKRILTFRVTVDDQKERVGEGTHQRAIIDVARFQQKVEAKKGAARLPN